MRSCETAITSTACGVIFAAKVHQTTPRFNGAYRRGATWPCLQAGRTSASPSNKCEGDGDVVGVVTPLGGAAQAFHGDQVVELRVPLAVQEVEGKEEDREGQDG